MTVYAFPEKVKGPVILIILVLPVHIKRLFDPSLQFIPELEMVKGAKISK